MRTFLLRICLLMWPALLCAAPNWPQLPSDATLNQVAQAYLAKYSQRIENVPMPGSPPDGGYMQMRYEALRFLPYHNPKIADPAAASEGFLMVKRISEEVRDGQRRRIESFELLRLIYADDGGFAFTHVYGWPQLPSDTELGQFLGGFLNSLYAQSLVDGYSADDVWLYGFASGGGQINIAVYDGSGDTTRMPFTFQISVELAGKSAANTDIGLRFVGQVRALADRFAVWDEASQHWIDSEPLNLALPDLLPVKLDARGQAIVRGYLDFGRMHLFGLKLPVETGIEVSVAGLAPKQAAIKLQHPAFVRNLYFWCANDPQWPGASRWIRLSYLNGPACAAYLEETEDREVFGTRIPRNRYGIGDRPSYPMPGEIPKRVLINGQPFQMPDWQHDFYAPLSENDELIIDMSASGKVARSGFSPMPDDGVMVEMLWLDGVTAMFAQRRGDEDFLALRLPRSSDSLQGTGEQTWIRFFVDQAADWLVTDRLIQAGVVTGATIAGGPVAGAWAAVICEAGLHLKDAAELVQAGTAHHKVVLVRSQLAVTHPAGAGMELYTFEGQPGILWNGQETRAGAGEAISFTLDGAPGPARPSAPPAAASALLAAAPNSEAPGSVEASPAAPVTSDQNAADSVSRDAATPLTMPVEADDELITAQAEFDQAYRAYTILVTTGGEGDVTVALARYKAAYERLNALKQARGLE
jgi:hypothetical protein